MDKSKKMFRSSGPKSCKSAQRELTSEQNCRIVSSLYKTLTPDLNRPPKFKTCQGCSASTCYACPEEFFIDESVLEAVSDDLALLRCHLCEWAGNLTYAHFCPEPWFNKEIILARLDNLKTVLRMAGGENVPEAKLTDQGLMDDLIDRIIQTIKDGDAQSEETVSDEVHEGLELLRAMFYDEGDGYYASGVPSSWMGKDIIVRELRYILHEVMAKDSNASNPIVVQIVRIKNMLDDIKHG